MKSENDRMLTKKGCQGICVTLNSEGLLEGNRSDTCTTYCIHQSAV